MGVDGQRHAPAALPAWKRPGARCTRGLVGLGSGLDGCGKSLPPHPVGFEPITVQPLASRYTDYAIPSAACRPKYILKIQFLPHRKQTASPIQRRTFVSLLSTGLLMVGGKLTSISCCLLLYMFCTIIYSVLILRYYVVVVFKLCRMGTNTLYIVYLSPFEICNLFIPQIPCIFVNNSLPS